MPSVCFGESPQIIEISDTVSFVRKVTDCNLN